MFSSVESPPALHTTAPGILLALPVLVACLLTGCSDRSGETPARESGEATHVVLDPDRVGYYGLGRHATAEEIAGWDIDVNAVGEGLPSGSGSVEDGEYLYDEVCADCHGSFGEGADRYPKLAGGEGSLTDARPLKTVGSYWKYTSTLWDYIHRAMPFLEPESLSDNEVYALTAYVLYLNDLVEDDFVLTRENLTSIRLPNEENFVADPRPDVSNTRCMQNCRDSVVVAAIAPRTDDAGNPLDDESPAMAVRQPPAPEPAGLATGAAVYAGYCALCHAAGMGGAPVTGDPSAWQPRIELGMDLLIEHALQGYTGDRGVMPARGGFPHLQDEQVIAAVHYMMEAVR